jgi:hypothetical protein
LKATGALHLKSSNLFPGVMSVLIDKKNETEICDRFLDNPRPCRYDSQQWERDKFPEFGTDKKTNGHVIDICITNRPGIIMIQISIAPNISPFFACVPSKSLTRSKRAEASHAIINR